MNPIEKGAASGNTGDGSLFQVCFLGRSTEDLAQQPEQKAGRGRGAEDLHEQGNQTSHSGNTPLHSFGQSWQENCSVKNTAERGMRLQGMISSQHPDLPKRKTAAAPSVGRMQRSFSSDKKERKKENANFRCDQRLTLKAAMPG